MKNLCKNCIYFNKYQFEYFQLFSNQQLELF